MKRRDEARPGLASPTKPMTLAAARMTGCQACQGLALALGALAAALVVAGCAAQPESLQPSSSLAAASADTDGAGGSQSALASPDRQERLQRLWQQRTSEGAEEDFALGPGDVLQISVPLEQLRHREFRISPRDTITLPLVGVMDVRGMNEQELTEALRTRLSKYMHDPPVSLFVKRYGSREVAVIGAVGRPGLYTLSSGSDTLLDMISKAGGATKDAANEVIFVPAASARSGVQPASFIAPLAQAPDDAVPTSLSAPSQDGAGDRHRGASSDQVGPVKPLAAGGPGQERASGPSASILARLHPIVISMADPQARAYLEMPARPGDVLLVPAAGEVTVGGWVRQPGAYKITPGMTALSAISAAGGAMFSSSAEVLRAAPDGERETISVNIPQVQDGQASDVPVQSGDVVMVNRSALGAIPYAAYEIFNKFGTGMYLPIP
jgi:protein involved in polysaccharide export with SLBB domain